MAWYEMARAVIDDELSLLGVRTKGRLCQMEAN